MLQLSAKVVATIAARYQKDINDLMNSQGLLNPMLELLTLTKIQTDLPLLLNALNNHKNSKVYYDAQSQLLELSNQVDELFYTTVKKADDFSLRYVTEDLEIEVIEEASPQPPTKEEDLASLRNRLLKDGTSTSLDNASTDQMNDYHETFQEDLLSDLGELASALKTSAATLSSKILDDSKLVSTAGENLEKNLTLMLSVGTNLNGYLNEKSGGKISLFFLIKTMAFIFILTFFMIVLIKILPKM
ncbi:CIC11C00000000586 [Sungouiella intermedia]|uniref:CIC11C00000000586 n=1 Tax=Sungouiella intermedia TaxID=45354 RepID=A0A1L0D2I0_9ASCO|nr:CIC11C00000000586 [[Candida] intermedia]